MSEFFRIRGPEGHEYAVTQAVFEKTYKDQGFKMIGPALEEGEDALPRKRGEPEMVPAATGPVGAPPLPPVAEPTTDEPVKGKSKKD